MKIFLWLFEHLTTWSAVKRSNQFATAAIIVLKQWQQSRLSISLGVVECMGLAPIFIETRWVMWSVSLWPRLFPKPVAGTQLRLDRHGSRCQFDSTASLRNRAHDQWRVEEEGCTGRWARTSTTSTFKAVYLIKILGLKDNYVSGGGSTESMSIMWVGPGHPQVSVRHCPRYSSINQAPSAQWRPVVMHLKHSMSVCLGCTLW